MTDVAEAAVPYRPQIGPPRGQPAIQPRIHAGDRYLYLLYFLLAGYACFGRSFASVGFGAVYVGEVTLAVGLFVAIRTGCIGASFNSFPNVVLATLIGWVAIRTVPYVGVYGVAALRDSVIVMYGLFAFVVVALLLEQPQRLSAIMRVYSRFIGFFVVAGVFIAIASAFGDTGLPKLPGTDIPIVSVRLGELASHLAAAAVFALLGMRRTKWWWVLALLAGIASLAPSRGGMIACLISIGLGATLGRRISRLVPILLVGGAIFFLAYASGIQVKTDRGRSLGAPEIVQGLESVLGSSDTGNFDGTKTWRLHWWAAIRDYTFNGPYFWTGKGFGVNLAIDDGFLVGQEFGGPLLRSPHSGNMTILARSGVPGISLWALLLGSWFATMLATMFKARRRGDWQFANLFIWVICYLVAMWIDASFDVALEGPMLGIWFWCVFGLGTGAAMIYRAAVNTLPPRSTAPIELWSEAPAPAKAL